MLFELIDNISAKCTMSRYIVTPLIPKFITTHK